MVYYSFDIFDTLIARQVASDRGIFAAMRERMRTDARWVFEPHFVSDFMIYRVQAQVNGQNVSGGGEVTLAEIYEALGREHPVLGREQLEYLRELEEELEIAHCYGIPENIGRVLELRRAGVEVVLVSDMYLDKGVVKRILGNADSRLVALPLYLSSEIKVRKFDGSMFPYVCEDLGISPRELRHCGDNFHSDYLMAGRFGVGVDFYKGSSLSEVEKSYFLEEGNLFLQLAAGASKQARVEGYDERPSFRLGAGYTGPLFYGFVHDLLMKAVAEGIGRVYFLARDGFLLKVIAEEIVAGLGLDVEVRYLYVSRQATYFASLVRLNRESCGWIFQEMDNEITFKRVAKRLEMDAESLAGLLRPKLRDSLIRHGYERRLTRELIGELEENFLGDVGLRESIEGRAAEYREGVLGYFEQEGLLDGGRVGLADIGWKGTLQDAIFKIARSRRADFAVTSYYLAVTHFSAQTCAENRKVPFCMFPSTRPGIGPMLELLLQCDHGTTLGYRRGEDGGYGPVLKAAAVHQEGWGVGSYGEGIRRFSRLLTEGLGEYAGVEPCYMGMTPILIELLEDGAPEVSNVLGDLHYCGDLEESHLRRFAPPFRVGEALRYVVSGNYARGCFTQWFEVSYARSDLAARVVLMCDPRRNLRSLGRCVVRRDGLLKVKRRVRDFIKVQEMRIRRI